MCEEFAKRNMGVDKLCKTLNDYLGQIQDAVLKAGGDVIEFAGTLNLWLIFFDFFLIFSLLMHGINLVIRRRKNKNKKKNLVIISTYITQKNEFTVQLLFLHTVVMQVSNNNTIIRKQYKNKLNTEMNKYVIH